MRTLHPRHCSWPAAAAPAAVPPMGRCSRGRGQTRPKKGVGWVAQIKLKLFSCNWSLRGVETVRGFFARLPGSDPFSGSLMVSTFGCVSYRLLSSVLLIFVVFLVFFLYFIAPTMKMVN